MTTDTLGDRLKAYEMTTDYVLPSQLPLILRLDGRAFSNMTRKLGFERPMDEVFHQAMVKTTIAVCEEITNARIGYTQSDEISILIYPKYLESQPFFGNRICKIVSVISGLASVCLYRELMASAYSARIKESNIIPTFDARLFNIPVHDAANAFLWRLRDAAKNSISAYAEKYFSHRSLDGVTTTDRLEMLKTKGVIWENEPSWKKYGTAVVKQSVEFTGKFGPPGRETEQTVMRSEWKPIEPIPHSPLGPAPNNDGDRYGKTMMGLIKDYLSIPIHKAETVSAAMEEFSTDTLTSKDN